MKIEWTYATLVALSIAIIVGSVILRYVMNRQKQHEDFDNGVNMLGSRPESSYDNAFGDSRTFATQNFGWDDGLNAEFNTWFNTPKDIPGGRIGGNSFDAPPAPSGSGSCRWVCDADDMNQYQNDADDHRDVNHTYEYRDDRNNRQTVTQQTVFDDDGILNDPNDSAFYGPYSPSDDGRWDGRESNGRCAPGYAWDGQECLNVAQAAQDNNVAIWTNGPSTLPPPGPQPGPAPAPVPTPGPTPKPGPKPAPSGTWVTITAVNQPKMPRVGGGSYVIVSYVNPTTKKNVTMEVQTGNPPIPGLYDKPLPLSGRSLAKAGGETNGVGGQLLLSPTGEVIDGRPKSAVPGPTPSTTLIQGTVTSNPSANSYVATYKIGTSKTPKTYAFTNKTGKITKNQIIALKTSNGTVTGVSTVFPTLPSCQVNYGTFVYGGLPGCGGGGIARSGVQGTVTSNPSPDHYVATYKIGTSKTPKTYAFTDKNGKITKNQIVALKTSNGTVTGVSTVFPAGPKGIITRNLGNFMYTK